MKEQIQKLQQEMDKETDFTKRLELGDQIHKLKMQESNITCSIDDEECLSCGS